MSTPGHLLTGRFYRASSPKCLFLSINLMSDLLHTLRRGPAGREAPVQEFPPKEKLSISTLAKAFPWLLVSAFLLLSWWLFHDYFERGRPVEWVRVVTIRASAETVVDRAVSRPATLYFEGAPLFQASGWIESDPLPVRVTTLYSGVVAKVHVLQGEQVRQGQILATMVDDDARLDLETAQAMEQQAEAGLEQSRSAVIAAESSLITLDKEIASAEARLAEVTDQFERLNKAGNNVFRESEIRQAQLRRESQQKSVEAMQSRVHEVKAQLRIQRAGLEAAEARLSLARVEVRRRQLALDRTQVRSPVDGRIQQLYAAPGMKRMLNMDGMETATIATVFQPDSLQARIDVPLEEAAQLVPGQPVRLRSVLLPNQYFKGQVTRIDGQADLQRNTLQAKVRLLESHELLRPEMLCRAEFLASDRAEVASLESSPASSGRVALYLAETALVRSGESVGAWVLDAEGQRIEFRELHLGEEHRDGHIRVSEGLRSGDFVVNHPPSDLDQGQRVVTPGDMTQGESIKTNRRE